MATRTAAVRFDEQDDEVLKKLRESMGAKNDSDVIRFALREALRVREGRRAPPRRRGGGSAPKPPATPTAT